MICRILAGTGAMLGLSSTVMHRQRNAAGRHLHEVDALRQRLLRVAVAVHHSLHCSTTDMVRAGHRQSASLCEPFQEGRHDAATIDCAQDARNAHTMLVEHPLPDVLMEMLRRFVMHTVSQVACLQPCTSPSLAAGLVTTESPEEGQEKLTIGGEEASALLDRALVILERVCAAKQRSCDAVLCAAWRMYLSPRDDARGPQSDAARTDASVRRGVVYGTDREGSGVERGGGGLWSPSVAAFLFFPVAPLLPPAALMHWRSVACRSFHCFTGFEVVASCWWYIAEGDGESKAVLLKPVDCSMIKIVCFMRDFVNQFHATQHLHACHPLSQLQT